MYQLEVEGESIKSTELEFHFYSMGHDVLFTQQTLQVASDPRLAPLFNAMSDFLRCRYQSYYGTANNTRIHSIKLTANRYKDGLNFYDATLHGNTVHVCRSITIIYC